jgi:hypothetical protein
LNNYLLCGRTGVGKSSLVNSLFGDRRAQIDHYRPCTSGVSPYAGDTGRSEVCLVDTPGLAEADSGRDAAYLSLVKDRLRDMPPATLIYVSPLNDTRFRDVERSSLLNLTTHLGAAIWRSSWLVFTFAASVEDAYRDRAVDERVSDIANYLDEITTLPGRGPRFPGFRQILLVDNKVSDWSPNCRPLSSFIE